MCVVLTTLKAAQDNEEIDEESEVRRGGLTGYATALLLPQHCKQATNRTRGELRRSFVSSRRDPEDEIWTGAASAFRHLTLFISLSRIEKRTHARRERETVKGRRTDCEGSVNWRFTKEKPVVYNSIFAKLTRRKRERENINYFVAFSTVKDTSFPFAVVFI